MNILILDTSCEHEIIIVAGEKVGGGFYSNSKKEFKHSSSLFDRIDTVLAEVNLTIHDIESIVCGEGPGSFTGVRIALTTARTLAQLLSVPLIGVRSHLLYALAEATSVNDYLLVAFDAKKSRVFGALYRKESGSHTPTCLVEEGDYSIELLLNHVPAGASLVCIGNGTVCYQELICASFPDAHFGELYKPSREAIVLSVCDLVAANTCNCSSYKEVLPFYARKSDAEVMMDLRKSRSS